METLAESIAMIESILKKETSAQQDKELRAELSILIQLYHAAIETNSKKN
jgi:hypothetical protein